MGIPENKFTKFYHILQQRLTPNNFLMITYIFEKNKEYIKYLIQLLIP